MRRDQIHGLSDTSDQHGRESQRLVWSMGTDSGSGAAGSTLSLRGQLGAERVRGHADGTGSVPVDQ